MQRLALDDLRRIMTECAGADGSVAVSDDVANVSFDELGYDSLALIETVARIGQERSVRIPDAELTELATPQQLLDFVNNVLAVAS